MANYKEKECCICHKLFVPTHSRQSRCSGPHYRTCPVCGKSIPWKEYVYCCSKECTNKMRKSTNLKKYGVEIAQKSPEVIDKSKNTTREHYGVDYPSQDPTIKQKQLESFDKHFGKETNPEGYKQLDQRRRLTCLEKYGTEYSFQSDNNKTKSKQTCLEKYGTEYAMQSEIVKSAHKHTVLEKYGVDNVMKSREVIQRIKEPV